MARRHTHDQQNHLSSADAETFSRGDTISCVPPSHMMRADGAGDDGQESYMFPVLEDENEPFADEDIPVWNKNVESEKIPLRSAQGPVEIGVEPIEEQEQPSMPTFEPPSISPREEQPHKTGVTLKIAIDVLSHAAYGV